MTTVVIPVYDEVTQLDFTASHQFFSMVPDITVIVASVGASPSHRRDFPSPSSMTWKKLTPAMCFVFPEAWAVFRRWKSHASFQRFAVWPELLNMSLPCVPDRSSWAQLGCSKGDVQPAIGAWRDMLSEFGAAPDASRVVRDGNVLTGRGVTAGVDFALTLIAELRGPDVAQCVQLGLEYAPAPPFDAGRPNTARCTSARP